MSLREEMARYEQLRGESSEHTPIIKLGAYLDGVDKGIEELEKIKEEIQEMRNHITIHYYTCNVIIEKLFDLLDKHISELKGETE